MKTLALLLPLAWRNIWRHGRRTLILLSAIAVGVASMVLMSAILNAWSDSMLNSALVTLTGDGQVHSPGYLDDPDVTRSFEPPASLVKTIKGSPEVSAWAERVRVPGVVMSERASLPVTLVGVDPEAERGLSFIDGAIRKGRQLSGSDDRGIVLGHHLAERLQTGLGKRVVLMSKDLHGGMSELGYKVVGIYAASARSTEMRYVFLGLRQAQGQLGLGSKISEISFMLHDRSVLPGFLRTLRRVAPQLDIKGWKDLIPFTRALLKMNDGFIQLWTVVMFIALAFGLVNVLLMAVMERTRELGLLQALGMKPRGILVEVLLESAITMGIGVLAGTALGGGLVLAFHNGIHLGGLSAGSEWFGGGRTLYPRVSQGELIWPALFVWVMGTLVTLYPAWRAARGLPTDVMNRT
jgi:ABC-type lipoprotein release transport system permease subunit